MRAIAVYPGKAGTAHLREVDKTAISDSEILMRSLCAGICGTDLEINQGLYGTAPEGCDYLIMGHESIGVVEEIGDKVENLYGTWIFPKLAVGDYVVRTVRRPCGKCDNCSQRMNDACSTGYYTESGIKGIHGVMADYYKDSPEYLVLVPPEHKDVAVLLEPLSVVMKATRLAFRIHNDKSREQMKNRKSLVIGAGPIGLLEAMILRSLNMETYVVARSPKGNVKSGIVEEIGGTYISSSEEPLNDLRKRVGGFDFIFEASGSSDMAFQAMRSLGMNGILCLTSITGGNKYKNVPADKMNLDFVLGNKCVFGTVNANYEDYSDGIKFFEMFEKHWPGLAGKLITKRLPVERFKEGFEKSREDIKTVIDF